MKRQHASTARAGKKERERGREMKTEEVPSTHDNFSGRSITKHSKWLYSWVSRIFIKTKNCRWHNTLLKWFTVRPTGHSVARRIDAAQNRIQKYGKNANNSICQGDDHVAVVYALFLSFVFLRAFVGASRLVGIVHSIRERKRSTKLCFFRSILQF